MAWRSDPTQWKGPPCCEQHLLFCCAALARRSVHYVALDSCVFPEIQLQRLLGNAQQMWLSRESFCTDHLTRSAAARQNSKHCSQQRGLFQCTVVPSLETDVLNYKNCLHAENKGKNLIYKVVMDTGSTQKMFAMSQSLQIWNFTMTIWCPRRTLTKWCLWWWRLLPWCNWRQGINFSIPPGSQHIYHNKIINTLSQMKAVIKKFSTKWIATSNNKPKHCRTKERKQINSGKPKVLARIFIQGHVGVRLSSAEQLQTKGCSSTQTPCS